MLEPGLPETAGTFSLDDPLALGMQLNVIANATTEGTGCVLHNGQAHFAPHFIRSCFRPDRAARKTFSPAPGQGNSPGCGAAYTGRSRSSPRAVDCHRLLLAAAWEP